MSARVAWIAFSALAAALALGSLARFGLALSFDGPLIYGEGAVAHAGQLIARGVDPYGPTAPGHFVAANYAPLAYVIAALGEAFGAFTPLRAVTVLGFLAVCGAIVARARSPLIGTALAAAFLSLFPVTVWAPLTKPDPLAVAFVALAVAVLGRGWPRAIAAGCLAALAVSAKPTALLPFGAVLAWSWWRDRDVAPRLTLAFAAASLALLLASLTRFGAGGMFEHIVSWNALPYSPLNAVLLVVVGLISFGAFAILGARVGDGRMRAYLAGAFALALLGGREGATINYLLDLAAASCLALAPALRVDRALLPAALAAQLGLATLAIVGGVFSPTGAWGDPQRVALASDLPRTAPHLAEESGLLVANGIEPDVDDIFLWSRLVAAGAIADEVTPRASEGEFASVIAEVPLDALDAAPAFERQRWPPALVRAVLGSYRLEVGVRGFYRYVPRRSFALH